MTMVVVEWTEWLCQGGHDTAYGGGWAFDPIVALFRAYRQVISIKERSIPAARYRECTNECYALKVACLGRLSACVAVVVIGVGCGRGGRAFSSKWTTEEYPG